MKITVLGGGDSTEREVSLRSAAAVATALRQVGFEVINLDPKDGLEDLDKNNGIIFPILHGQGGEDGSLQLKLESMQLPYLGSDSGSSTASFDKVLTRQILVEKGLPVAKGVRVNKYSYREQQISKLPHVLKVARGGSSIGTYLVRDPDKVDQAKVDEVFSLDHEALIEELVEGTEITIAVLDAAALPVIEIVPPSDAEFDYENKYNGKTQEICPPQSISQDLQAKAQELAEQVHKALGARHLSRVDMIVRPSGELVVLELNTMPGMTEQSLYPLSAATNNISMPELMKRFVNLVERDYKL